VHLAKLQLRAVWKRKTKIKRKNKKIKKWQSLQTFVNYEITKGFSYWKK
jgi:hypothetical protein